MKYFCGCPKCTVGAVTGPLLLIAVGTLFAVDHFGPYRFSQTWPILLIVYGASRALAFMVPAQHN